MSKDLYAILGVPKDADDDALKKAYRKQAVRFHPDKHATKGEAEKAAAAEKFKDAAEAYEVLSDKDKRAVYDRYGYEALKAGGPCTGGNVSASMGGFPGGVRTGHGMPGGMSFSFSSSGGGGGMDDARAAELFSAIFGGSDPFTDLLGGSGMRGATSMMGGMPPRHRSNRAARAAADMNSNPELLRPGTQVKLQGLSDTSRNGAIGTIEVFDAAKQRYTVSLADSSIISVKGANILQVVSAAKVIGTSQAALNGKVAASATYDASSKRYRVEGLTADGKTLAVKPENLVLPERTVVTIDGVQSRPALNGKRGRIVDIDTAAERYTVATTDEQIRLRFGTVVAAC